MAERLAEFGRRGAEATARRFQREGLDPGELPPLDGPRSAAEWLEIVGRAVAEGRLPHRNGDAVVRAVRAFLAAHEAGEVADSIAELQAAVRKLKGEDPPPGLRVVR